MAGEGWAEYLNSLIPLNARVFARNAFRGEDEVGSLINAEDFSEAEIEEIYRRIDFQNERNARKEREYRDLIPAYEKHLVEYPETPFGIESIREMGGGQEDGLSDEEIYQRNLGVFHDRGQAKIDEARLALESYDKDRSKTSVGYYSDPDAAPAYYYGRGIMDTIEDSFTSPAYNVNTTLGQFNAFEDEDGTVTIRDTYDWGMEKDNPYSVIADMGILDLLRSVPRLAKRPEMAGNVLMRTLLKGKSSPVEFTLPPRQAEYSPY
jgi:hypothetical protein